LLLTEGMVPRHVFVPRFYDKDVAVVGGGDPGPRGRLGLD
jgi:hypothetical protein